MPCLFDFRSLISGAIAITCDLKPFAEKCSVLSVILSLLYEAHSFSQLFVSFHLNLDSVDNKIFGMAHFGKIYQQQGRFRDGMQPASRSSSSLAKCVQLCFRRSTVFSAHYRERRYTVKWMYRKRTLLLCERGVSKVSNGRGVIKTVYWSTAK